MALITITSSYSKSKSHVVKREPVVGPLVYVSALSQLPPNLNCLILNNLGEITGYTWYQNVAFESQIAVNPKNPKNIVVVTQQDALTDANPGDSSPVAIVAFYTLDGGKTWNQSDLVMSRCQGATLYQANDSFLSAYFPSVSFDREGNCYVLSQSYNLFAANDQPTIDTSEGNFVAKSTDGGASWNRVIQATRDDGTCNDLFFSRITADPSSNKNVYIVSADLTCLVNGTCTENPNFNSDQNIMFQKSEDGGASWTQPSLVASFPPTNFTICTPTPFAPQLKVLPDLTKTLLVTAMIVDNNADVVQGTAYDRILAWRSEDGGMTWNVFTVTSALKHVLPFDPATSNPQLPVTDYPSKDMTVRACNGDVYIVYSDPLFNPTGQAGCVIKKSKDGGKTWSQPRPINPNTLNVQTFLPSVAVAKDGTVGVLFYDFRNFQPGSEMLSTDVWVSFFDKSLKHYKGEVRLTPQSFNARLTFRGYSGIDLPSCTFDYYLSELVQLAAINNDFIATFSVTNSSCAPVPPGTLPCDAFPVISNDCERQDVVFARIKRKRQ